MSFAIRHRLAAQDLVFLAGALACVGYLGLEYDFFHDEGIAQPSEQKLELDEILTLGAILIVGLLVFAWRRMQQYKKELMRRIEAERDAFASARHDPLTGLPNRRYFTESAGEALRRAWDRGSQCAVLFLDLDGFKPVNDTLGHAAGDTLLIEVANRLRMCVPDRSGVARLGGDEFAVLIELTEPSDAVALAAKRILREIRRPILIDGRSVSLDATVGVAVGPESGRRAEDLIHAADVAMYEGKRAGRGTVRMFKAA